jgi:uncharacterized protein YutE (UPF0331/DUF86 family)
VTRVTENEKEAWVAELVDARDLKSLGGPPPCRFNSGPRHHGIEGGWEISQPPSIYSKRTHTPMNEVLFNKLQRLKEETKYLKDNKPKFLRNLNSSVETKKIVERSVYLCTEIILDIADLLITKKKYPKPSSYSDSICKLGDYGFISKKFAYQFVYIAGLRNFLAHDYQKSTIPMLEKFLKYGLKDLMSFIKAVDALL